MSVNTSLVFQAFQTQFLFTENLCSLSVSTSASSIQPPPPTKSPCPDGYISWYQNCYKLVEQPVTWEAAQEACVQEGGNLASIDMSYDQAFVAGVVLHGMDAWIGLRRKVMELGTNCYNQTTTLIFQTKVEYKQ